MKVLPEINPPDAECLGSNAFALPHGIIGFADYKRAELLYSSEHLPFLWMRLQGPAGTVNFVVIEPAGIVPGYELEIFDNDAEALDLGDPTQAMVLNIVTLRPEAPLEATANLIGPIVINRRTRVGRQLVIANYSKYSARHILVQNDVAPVLASA
ncbi:MAG: flagellar assembly protein FliW [Opitutaceae bacterium]